MTTRPMIREHNTETDQVIDREMNDEEYAKYTESLNLIAEKELVEAQKAVDKAELLTRLGLTAEEAALLLS